MQTPIYRICPGCQGIKSPQAQMCRKCLTARAERTWNTCPGCGKRIRQPATQCRECYDKEREAVRPLCIDCGQPTKRYAAEYAATRCWPCEVKHRRDHVVRLCSVEGCQNPHMAKGYCRHHYNSLVVGRKRRSYGQGHRGNQLAGWLSEMPCQVCGYDRLHSTLHRIDPPLGYRPGNMVAVCRNCHAEIEHGLIPCPMPYSADEITNLHQSALTPPRGSS